MTSSRSRAEALHNDSLRHPLTGLPPKQGLYDPQFERDNCGVGFIAHLDGQPRRSVVGDGISILLNLQHRGGQGADSADGAGLLSQVPDALLREECLKRGFALPEFGAYGVGMLFLPENPEVAHDCRRLIESTIADEQMQLLGWRQVPVAPEALTGAAHRTMPSIWQVFVEGPSVSNGAGHTVKLEARLFVLRRLIEKRIGRVPEAGAFYVASFSTRTIVYKGMMTGRELDRFYLDLGDERFTTPFALVHQRYSTNTFPTWALAHPFRFAAHNGEINTLRGNVNRWRAREAVAEAAALGVDIERIKPILNEYGSDSAIMDNMLELLVHAGRSLPHAMMMMIPEAWEHNNTIGKDKQAFYEYHSTMMEPWDGPAAVMFTDGRYIGATLDRNGLRPARYTLTKDGRVILASETGALPIRAEDVQARGRLQPGKMFLVDLEQHRVVPDHEIKIRIARSKPYRAWVRKHQIELRGLFTPPEPPAEEREVLLRRQHAFGYTDEELNLILSPMAANGQEAIGSMGCDASLPVLSRRPQLVFSYFKQLFAQVTNPPIDPLREELVMSLMSYVGREANILAESPEHCARLKLNHPILTTKDIERLKNSGHERLESALLPTLFPAAEGPEGLEPALRRLFQQAEEAVHNGASLLILSDRDMDREQAPMPTMLASSGLHHYLIRKGLRTKAGIIVDSGEVREVMHFALLIGYGANAVCPHTAFAVIRQLAEDGLLNEGQTFEAAADNYITAIKKGLLKTFSRMGISTLRSFLGSQIFEAVGIHEGVIERYFTGTASRLGGIGVAEMAVESLARHEKAYPRHGRMAKLLDVGGVYHARLRGEAHLWDTEGISNLQHAVRTDNADSYRKYAHAANADGKARVTLRSMLAMKGNAPVPLDEVEPVEAIAPRFVTAAMSLGSISREAHESIAIAMNRLGGRSNSGEGGEDPARYLPDANGVCRNSRIKQVASGRFGVTPAYLLSADELQIKVAQGAKPGEGGQLPGFKVSAEIARVRHTTPGVTLISPPPHHDIYSIEDLAQLIYDLRMANPRAKISVKLVAAVGVGTIAAGVAKAGADLVLISGHDGGTGASPMTSIQHVGLPWELGLAEAQQTLRLNRLRERIRVQVDGQLRTGRDLAVAALLGAEEFGFGTSVLISLGCILMRKCHLNTCPVGIATQDEELRKRFGGAPDHVERLFRFLAQDLREHMADLGFRTLDEMIGRVDCLKYRPDKSHPKASKLKLGNILFSIAEGSRIQTTGPVPEIEHTLAARILNDARHHIAENKPFEETYEIGNTDRTVGTLLSSFVVERHGAKGLQDGTIRLNFEGSAGQSLGAYLAPGVDLRVTGDANDYVGKGMSGGRIVVCPPKGVSYQPGENIIAGNVVLYGATGGEIYLRGMAGERFCVRNSGATAVVEGVGAHGCEYMTGGTVVILGPTGHNFAAGMSGGIAYVYDTTELFDTRCNLDMVDLEGVWQEKDKEVLRKLIKNHQKLTGSRLANKILNNWQDSLPLFVKVIPVEYRQYLERVEDAKDTAADVQSATEEVMVANG